MKNTKWKIADLPIKDLSLWDENARFPSDYFNKKEQELISYFLSKKDFKIREFAYEVVAEFDLPQLERIVVLQRRGKNIVLEGNRRLTVYKLLINPSLTQDSKTKKLFYELRKQIKIDDNFKLESNITTDKEEGLRFLNRKHNKGNNEIGWGEFERRNFAIRTRISKNIKDVYRAELGKLVKEIDLPEQIKNDVLGRGMITNFYRIIDSAPAREKMGYKVLDDGRIEIKNVRKFSNLLKIVTYNIWSKKSFTGRTIDSRTLNKIPDIKSYFDSISEGDVRKVNNEIVKITRFNLFGEAIVAPPIYTKRGQKVYLSLIPPNKGLPRIQSGKIRCVFKELETIEVSSCPTASAALLRILLELIVKELAYLKGYKINPNSGDLIVKGQTPKKYLKERLNYFVNKYIPKDTTRASDIRSAMATLNKDLLTQNLNEVMHSTIFLASEPDLRSFWGTFEIICDFLIEEIIKEERKKNMKRTKK